MAKNDGIKIGVFGQTPSSTTTVPKNMVNKRIWFSPSRQYFIATDESNKSVFEFKFDSYEKFVNADVILFSSSGIKSRMDKYFDEWKNGSTVPVSSPRNGDMNRGDSPVLRRRTNRRDDREENLDDHDVFTQKDPSRSIRPFCIVTAVLTAVIVIIINFGETIVESVSPLIS